MMIQELKEDLLQGKRIIEKLRQDVSVLSLHFINRMMKLYRNTKIFCSYLSIRAQLSMTLSAK